MSGRFLLDTNAAIARVSGEPAILTLLEGADEVFVPIIALGELYYGAEKSVRVRANIVQIETISLSGAVLMCDVGTAREYGRIHHQLRVKGRPIPQNDMWIAAIARQHSLTLLTRDAHFNDVDGLAVQGW